MASEPKTKPTDASVADFLEAVPHPGRREDGKVIAAMLTEVTGEQPVMWGPSIVGYGRYRGATGDWPRIGFSPRKGNMVLYVLTGVAEEADLLDRLGPHKTGKACLYINRLADVDVGVLRRMAELCLSIMKDRYPA
ncbi:DUF1801 domain-containing protein [Caulobacter mirabilis]|uniref:YdhG-like domain-containing protein n=1 Tax=Caulobacter mirabilis TaxID=69666 RepID=A0A2D2ATP3_9CAUL|nr:DUF1801 domain-containing protein [Caulobacter mirabilis]ATQ41369.1 hypothetical protein CSW64_02540 [Caulobacter mirabilis]